MKKLFILESSFVVGFEHIEMFQGFTFVFFKNCQEVLDIAGIGWRYDALLNSLRANHLAYETCAEESLEAYMRHHPCETLYISDPGYMHMLLSSALLLKFQGRIYIFDKINQTLKKPQFKEMNSMVHLLSQNKKSWCASMDNQSRITFSRMTGKRCYFMLEGHKQTFIVPHTQTTSAGVEGYTFLCPERPHLRIKLYLRDLHPYEIEKLEKMVQIPHSFQDSAMPLALVYTYAHQPVGIVMKHFEGEEMDIADLHQKARALPLARSIIRQLIELSVFGIYPKDFSHNILCEEENGIAHLIDLDSAQYLDYPAMVYPAQGLDCLPWEYYLPDIFFNAIELSYWVTYLLICTYQSDETFFGSCEMPLVESHMALLEKQNARVADLVRLAFENKEPLSLYRQLQALEGEVVQEPVSTPKRHWPLLAGGILLLVTILCVAVWKIM